MRTRTQKFSTPLTAARAGAAGKVNETRPLFLKACVSSAGGVRPGAVLSVTNAVLSGFNSDVNRVAHLRPSQNSQACLTTGVGYGCSVAGSVAGRVTLIASVTFVPAAEKASDCAR